MVIEKEMCYFGAVSKATRRFFIAYDYPRHPAAHSPRMAGLSWLAQRRDTRSRHPGGHRCWHLGRRQPLQAGGQPAGPHRHKCHPHRILHHLCRSTGTHLPARTQHRAPGQVGPPVAGQQNRRCHSGHGQSPLHPRSDTERHRAPRQERGTYQSRDPREKPPLHTRLQDWQPAHFDAQRFH